MAKSIIRKTYTGFTGYINGVRITIDGPNVRIRTDGPEAYLSKSDFARLVRMFWYECQEHAENRNGWAEDAENALASPKTPLFINGVKKTREMLKEEAMTPKYFRQKKSESIPLDDAVEMILEEDDDDMVL